MAQNIKLKRSSVAGKVPTTTQLEAGEIAINTVDGKLYFERDDASIQTIVTTNALITGSLNITGPITGSFLKGDGSAITGVVTSSYALTASYAANIPETASYALEADKLDNQHGSYYLDATNINAGTISDAYLPSSISSDITGNAATATTASYAVSASYATFAASAGSATSATTSTSASYATFAQSAATATSATSATTATSATSATTAATASSVSALGQNIVEIQNRLGVGTDNPFASIHIKSGSEAQLLIETDSPFDLGLGYSAGIRFKVEDTDAYDRAKGGIFFLNNSPNNEDWGRGDLILASNIDNDNTNVSTTDWRLKTDRAGHVHIKGNLIVTGSFSGTISSATSASYATFAASAGSAATATSATNADNINISATTSAGTVTSVVLVASQATGNQSPFIDSGLLYNANTNALTATTFVGALTGNADTATALTVGDKTVTGNLTVTGKITAEEFHTEFVSSSIIFSSGSTKFGDDASDFHDFTGSLRLATLDNANTDTDKFLVTDGSTVKYRTGAQLLSDIGGQTSGTFVTDAGGSAGQVGVWSSDTAMSGSNGLYWSGSNLGVGTATPLAKTHIAGGADVLLIQGSGSTANTTLFAVDGNNGRLFEISDDLSDSLFSVNTVAGLPVIEAFADNTVTLGAYNQYDLHITGSKVGINNSAPAYELHVSGTVAATALIETSARKFKEDIEPVVDALNTVTQLQGVTFVRIGEENREYGFIADEVADVAPELVSYDENGNPYGIQYARTVAILNEAIKELNTKVNFQELFIRDLLARIEKLENK